MYVVIERKICAECVGSGEVASPFWSAIAAENQERAAAGMSNVPHEEVFARARAQGLPDDLGPAVIPCPHCGGAGWITREVPLSVALRALGVEVE